MPDHAHAFLLIPAVASPGCTNTPMDGAYNCPPRGAGIPMRHQETRQGRSRFAHRPQIPCLPPMVRPTLPCRIASVPESHCLDGQSGDPCRAHSCGSWS